ncbi:MAG: hypothetical protein ACI9FU_001474 [Granulosicoccus sp.]|jgi:hypothetical protein
MVQNKAKGTKVSFFKKTGEKVKSGQFLRSCPHISFDLKVEK